MPESKDILAQAIGRAVGRLADRDRSPEARMERATDELRAGLERYDAEKVEEQARLTAVEVVEVARRAFLRWNERLCTNGSRDPEGEFIEIFTEELAVGDCDHEWVDMRNEVVESGELCVLCWAVRAPAYEERRTLK